MKTNIRLRIQRVLACALLAVSAGCDNDPAIPVEASGGSASMMLTAAGGAMEVQTASGARLSVEFPPGAVLRDTHFQIVALEPAAGQWERFRVRPAGFLLRPVTIQLVMPSGWNPGSRPRLNFGGNLVTTDYDPTARTLTSTTHYFGFAGNSAAPQPAPGVAAQDPEGNDLVAMEIECAELVTSLNAKVALAQTEGFSSPDLPKQIITEFAELAAGCPEQAGSVAQIEALLQQLACSEYAAAIADLQEGLPSNAEEIEKLVQRAVAAQGVKQEVNANCGTPDDFLSDIEPVFEAYVTAKTDELYAQDYALSVGDWESLWAELGAVIAVVAQTYCFGVDAAGDMIADEVIYPVTEIMRGVAYRACYGSNGTQGYLADLRAGGDMMQETTGGVLPLGTPYEENELEHDIQYCGSQLHIKVRDAGGEIFLTEVLGQEGQDFIPVYDIERKVDLLSVPADGTIDLTGAIRALKCVLVPPFPDKLQIRADFNLLTTLDPASDAFFGSAYMVDVAQVLTDLNKNPGDSFTLLLRRVGMCDDYLDMEPSYDLFEVEVMTGAIGVEIARHGFEATFSAYAEHYDVDINEQVTILETGGDDKEGLAPLTYTQEVDESLVSSAGEVHIEVDGTLVSTPDIGEDLDGDGRAPFYGYTATVEDFNIRGAVTGNVGDRATVTTSIVSRVDLVLPGSSKATASGPAGLPPITVTLDFTTQSTGQYCESGGGDACVTVGVHVPGETFIFRSSANETWTFHPSGDGFFVVLSVRGDVRSDPGSGLDMSATADVTMEVNVGTAPPVGLSRNTGTR